MDNIYVQGYKILTKAVKSDYEQLKEDYEKLLEKCNSLLLENFELKQKTHLKRYVFYKSN